jgi:hypothetical protein
MPTRTIPAPAPVKGTVVPLFKKSRTPRTAAEISFAAQSLSTAMTGQSYFSVSSAFDAAIAKNLGGDLNYTDVGGGLLVRYDFANDRLSLFDSDANGGVAVDAMDASRTIETWLRKLVSAGLRGPQYWTVDKPLVSEFVRYGGDDQGTQLQPELEKFVYSVYRKVNGIPWRDVYLTLWIERGGQVDLLEVTGLDGSLVGPAGSEVDSSGISSVISVSPSLAAAKLDHWFSTTFGQDAIPHWKWTGLTYEHDSADGLVKPYFSGLVSAQIGGVAARARHVRFRADSTDSEVEASDD